MKLTGIITEYNPLHRGHEFHINSSKEITNSDGLVCIMSGNFVQRGLPSLVDKWSRTQMALEAGVDLILELPTIYAVSSAEYFAFGAVSLLNSLKVIDNICFGSECGDINLIKTISTLLVNEPPEFKSILKTELSTGLPFAKARSRALLHYLKNDYNELDLENLLNSSNNILAIEYCKSIIKLDSKIEPYTIKRNGSNYNDENLPSHSFASASAIRNSLYSTNSLDDCSGFIPKYTLDILKESSFSDLDKMFNYLKYNIINNPTSLNVIPEAAEGLNNKIISSIKDASSISELIMLCKSKRYSYTRINRVLCQCFLGINEQHLELRKSPATYARVLGLNKKGAQILKKIKKTSDINIVNKISKYDENILLKLDIKATNLYSLLNPQIKLNSDFTTSPIIFNLN